METQGIFINICARAWQDGGYVEHNNDKLARLLRVDKQVLASAIQLLLDDDLLVESCADGLSSKFILLQLDERSTLSDKRSKAGRKGGKAKQLARLSKSQASAKQRAGIKEVEPEAETKLEIELPPNPQRGNGRKASRMSKADKKLTKVEANTKMMSVMGTWFGRKETTLWTVYENEALQKIAPTKEDALQMHKYYTAKIPSENDFRRRDLATLLNNWPSELDRAKGELDKLQQSKPQSEYDVRR